MMTFLYERFIDKTIQREPLALRQPMCTGAPLFKNQFKGVNTFAEQFVGS